MKRAMFIILNILLIGVISAEAATENIDNVLEPIRKKYNLPALSAALVKGGDVVAVGAVGVRKYGKKQTVTERDKFHIGSCTKSMTATVAAVLVHQGKLTWKTKIVDIFPELKASMNKDYLNVTLEQLLSHRGGMPTDLSKDGLWGRIWENTVTMSPTEQRYYLVREVTKMKPEATPGKKYIYSNAGVATAGAMMEKVMGKPWESLMKRYLFTPLKMSSAGFGPPATSRKTDQPWGHTYVKKSPAPFDPTVPGADNPPAIGPAGTVHCSISDFAKYAAFHVRGERGSEKMLPKEAFQKLHRAVPGQEYALGWIETKRSWGGGKVITHNGSNGMFFSVMWLAPLKEFAVVVSCNMGGQEAAAACDTVAGELIQKYLIQSK